MILDWWDTQAAQRAVEQFNKSGLAGEAERLKKVLGLYSETHAPELLDSASTSAPDFITRSLQVLGYQRWEQVSHKLQCIAAIKDHTNPKQAEEIRELVLLDNKDGDLIQLTILLSAVWPLLVNKVEGDAAFVQKLGHTVDSWSKLSPKEQDVAYSIAKREGRLSDSRPQQPPVSIQHAHSPRIEY